MNAKGNWRRLGADSGLWYIDFGQRGHDEQEVGRFSCDGMLWGLGSIRAEKVETP